jgi:hypothetical protein
MTRSNIFITTVLALGAIAIPLAASAHGKDSQKHVDESYDFKGFENLDIGGVYELDVQVGEKFALSTSGHEKEVENMKIYVDGDTLRVENKNKKWRMRNQKGIIIRISMPTLRSVDIGGVGTGEISGIDSERLDLDIGGVGELTLSGTCGLVEIDVAGVGELDARNLKCEDAEVDLAGVGEISVHASNSVDVSAAGVGEVDVYGNPEKVHKNKTFLSEVNIK